MSEQQIRLAEVQVLETFMDHNQIFTDALRNYLSGRRKAIIADYPKPVESPEKDLDDTIREIDEMSAGKSTPGPTLVPPQATQPAASVVPEEQHPAAPVEPNKDELFDPQSTPDVQKSAEQTVPAVEEPVVQDPAPAVEEPKPSEQTSGQGTQSPAPDAPQEPTSVPA